MPLPDGAFDIVASVFGAMFGPRPDSVVELFWVGAPAGLVAMANYGPGGFLAAFAELMSRYSRPAPVSCRQHLPGAIPMRSGGGWMAMPSGSTCGPEPSRFISIRLPRHSNSGSGRIHR